MNCTNNLHICSFFSLFLLLVVPSFGLNLDGTLLLSFKYSVLSDPLSVLDNWDYNDANPCSWTGVTCGVVQNIFGVAEPFRVISLVLPNSNLVGTLPEYLGLIQHLRTLDLSNNLFNGTLPSSLLNASELEVLSLSNTGISGVIPLSISGAKNLKVLNLSDNALAGNIPNSLTSLESLTVVSLRGNSFSGQIPTGIHSVQVLDLSSNLFNGTLPIEFGGENLKYLNLSSNKISGLVPQEFAAKIPPTATIDLSFNDLSGEIPDSGALSNQKVESFVGNEELCGKPIKKLCTIPSTLSNPPNISTSSPAIAAIPKTFGSTPPPDSSGETTTPPQITSRKGLKPAAIAGIAVADLAGVGILAVIFLYVYQKKKKANAAMKESSIPTVNAYEFKKDSDSSTTKETKALTLPTWHSLCMTNPGETSESTSSDSDENNNYVTTDDHHQPDNNQHEQIKKERSLVMVDGETELELENLLKASAYVLGSSGTSIVYKAVLHNGTSFAVRRIGESGVRKMKEFENGVKAIAKLKHQNLVRVRGFYWGDDEKLVIYDYVSNGSLATVGYRKTGSSPYHLPFGTRLKIAAGVARGLNYIHEKKNVHGNIKPSNILLTQDMEPIISDFGLHGLLYGKHSRKTDGPIRHFGSKQATTTHSDLHDQSFESSPYVASTGFTGCTSPYHAPESLNNLKPNPKWDVYSFGIVLLEFLTGKVFSDQELSQWTVSSIVEDPSQILRLADGAIRGDVAGREEAMLALLKLGFSCASLNPHKRPCMKDAIHVIEKSPMFLH